MNLAASISAIEANCELLIASHADLEGTGDCEKCGQPYPCYSRLTAEDVVDDLAKLARLDSPITTVLGYPSRKGATMTIVETEDGWRKSSYSDNSFGNCVQVKAAGGAYAIRDSKNPEGPVLIFTTAEFTAFKTGVTAGEFDF